MQQLKPTRSASKKLCVCPALAWFHQDRAPAAVLLQQTLNNTTKASVIISTFFQQLQQSGKAAV